MDRDVLFLKEKDNNLWTFVKPYWVSSEKKSALSLLIATIFTNLAFVYGVVILNKWYADFFDSFQNKDYNAFVSCLFQFLWLVFFIITLFILRQFLVNYLSYRWRQWLTDSFLKRWLADSIYYQLYLQKKKTDNPDQRISQDIYDFTYKTLSLFITLIRETVNLLSFIVILWSISGNLYLPLPSGEKFYIPGYLVWIALIYSLIGTLITYRIGKPLIKLDFEQEKVEADFRFSLARTRERREEIAIYKGEEVEHTNFLKEFHDITINYYKILKRQVYLHATQNFYANLSMIFPLIVCAPMFFSGALTLGVLMQVQNAYNKVEGSFSVIINYFEDIAFWRAITQRLSTFAQDMKEVESQKEKKDASINLTFLKDDFLGIHISQLTLKTREKAILDSINLDINLGEKVLIKGASGSGKTTLLRALAGIWPYGQGVIKLPRDRRILFIPQKPYLLIGTLKENVAYPSLSTSYKDEHIQEILTRCHLPHLSQQLEKKQDWGTTLSLGEQQRLAFARIHLLRPDILVMDEPTASLDPSMEKEMFTLLHQHFPKSLILTISHSESLKDFHDRVIDITTWQAKT